MIEQEKKLGVRDLNKLYPPTEAGLDFEMSPALNESIARFFGRSAAIGSSLDRPDRIASTIKLLSNLTPGPRYDVVQDGKIQRYSQSLVRSENHHFGLLSRVDVSKRGRIPTSLNMDVNLLNFYDRDRLVHQPFFVGDWHTSIQLSVPIDATDLTFFRKERINIVEQFNALKKNLEGGPVIKDVKTAPSEFYVTDPTVTLPFPPDIE
ncbi:hypothetical protein EPN95_00570 [Patescibacteria group bacterium]|nr:MAG: hypothetical protein EPN95_00570 [Patescibacteria group bacterium]